MAMQLHNSTDHFGNEASSNVAIANEAVVKQACLTSQKCDKTINVLIVKVSQNI